MYAIVETGGKQYRVAEGDVITVEKPRADEGEEIVLDRVLMVGERRRGEGRKAPGRRGQGDRQGDRPRQKAEDPGLQVQAEEELPPALRPPAAVHEAQDHQD